MWLNSFVTYLHFISVFGLFAVLCLEFFLIKPILRKSEIKFLAKLDLIYGLLSISVLCTGILRLLYWGKGSSYYLSNDIFLVKMGLFITVGLLSIYPTVKFLKLRRTTESTVTVKKFRSIKILIGMELIILLLIPFAAVLMANGIDI
jgi:putative membrane protein